MNFSKSSYPSLKFISFFLISGLVLFTSCRTPKDVTYFQDISENVITPSSPGQIKIEPNDKVWIMVKTMDPNVSALFNLVTTTDRVSDINSLSSGAGSLRTPTASTGVASYTVSPEGLIDFPVLGQLNVKGMTRSELAAFIKGEIIGRDLAKEPVVTVEFVNMGVSILGEVARPGLYDINQDRINILEAIAMAGDLTIQGKRENVALIRETEDGVRTYRVDMTNFKELSESPAYYLKQGDIIYIEPIDIKKRQTTNNGNNLYTTGFWISLASLLTSVVTTIAVLIK